MQENMTYKFRTLKVSTYFGTQTGILYISLHSMRVKTGGNKRVKELKRKHNNKDRLILVSSVETDAQVWNCERFCTCSCSWIGVSHVAGSRGRALEKSILLHRGLVRIARRSSWMWAVAIHNARWRIAIRGSTVLCRSSARSWNKREKKGSFRAKEEEFLEVMVWLTHRFLAT